MESAISGNGIQNIKRRAAENNWSVTWQQTNPTGTAVIISDRTTK
jgi:signal transduction histidine kinase